MKKLKILTSLVLMLVLCFSVVPFVNAAETYKITINGAQDEHVYKAYQIFSGDLATDESGKLILSNIKWGTDVNETALTSALKTNGVITDDTVLAKAEKVAEELIAFGDDSENLIKFADVAGKNLKEGVQGTSSTKNGDVTEITGLTPGYYLVKDTMPSATEESEDVVYSLFLLQVVGDANANSKAFGSRIEKWVANKSDYTDEATWNSATVGDTVYFKVKATLPTNMKGYNSYYFNIVDTMGTGFKLVSDSINVEMGGTALSTTASDTTYYTLNTNGNELTFDIENIDTETSAGKEVIITYSATLENAATRGKVANENNVVLTYSNDPHDVNSKGHTKASTKTYTTDIELHKKDFKYKDADDKGLGGAVFKVYEEGQTEVLRTGTTSEEEATIGKLLIGGLKAGTYEIEEVTPPVGFNLLAGRIKVTLAVAEDGTWTVTSEGPDNVNTPVTSVANENGIIELTVTNKSGTNLPSTGGVGTVIFTVVGLAIMGTVVVIAIGTNKKGSKSRR